MEFNLAFIVLVLGTVICTTFADLTSSEANKHGDYDENGLVEVLKLMDELVNIQQILVGDSKHAKVQSSSWLTNAIPNFFRNTGDKLRYGVHGLADFVQRGGEYGNDLWTCARECYFKRQIEELKRKLERGRRDLTDEQSQNLGIDEINEQLSQVELKKGVMTGENAEQLMKKITKIKKRIRELLKEGKSGAESGDVETLKKKIISLIRQLQQDESDVMGRDSLQLLKRVGRENQGNEELES